MNIKEIIAHINDRQGEGTLYAAVEELRLAAAPSNLPISEIADRKEAIDRGFTAVCAIHDQILKYCDPNKGEPGHGPGHWCRDYLHALLLAHDLSIPIEAIVPGMVAGSLHDIGTLFVDRYADRIRAVRHAEVGGLIVRVAALEANVLTEREADVVAYAIAAHTHYPRPQEVVCIDGMTRSVRPFDDMLEERPWMPVWFPRWADRLDCSGPCFPGRHWLTLEREHDDFSQDGFYTVKFVEHMRPLLRTTEEIKTAKGQQTFLEHMRMFADSQTNASVYGKFDAGLMVALRDEYRGRLERIIQSVTHPRDVNIPNILKAWTIFLGTNIEPSALGKKAAKNLAKGFEQLNPETQRAWAHGFLTIMREYTLWSAQMMERLNDVTTRYLTLPGLQHDLREMINPNSEWRRYIE